MRAALTVSPGAIPMPEEPARGAVRQPDRQPTTPSKVPPRTNDGPKPSEGASDATT